LRPQLRQLAALLLERSAFVGEIDLVSGNVAQRSFADSIAKARALARPILEAASEAVRDHISVSVLGIGPARQSLRLARVVEALDYLTERLAAQRLAFDCTGKDEVITSPLPHIFDQR
jgi:hypothetical protein